MAGSGVLLGYNSTIGISEELTFGTKVDSPSHIEFASESFKKTREEKKIETINGSRDYIKRVMLNETIEGSLEMNLNPASDAISYLIKQALGGTVTSAAITSTVDDQYSHIFNVGDMESNGVTSSASDVKSLSVQVDKGGRVWDFVGCRINTLTIKAEVGGLVTMSAEMIGKAASVTSSTPVAVFSDVIPCNFTGVTFETGDSLGNLATEEIQSFELSIANNLAGDTRSLGSRNIAKLPPLRREVMLKVTQRFDTTTSYDSFIAETISSIRITCDTAQVITSASSGAATHNLIIDLPRCYLNSNGMPEVGGVEVLSTELEYSAISQNTSTAYPVRITTQNGTSSYT